MKKKKPRTREQLLDALKRIQDVATDRSSKMDERLDYIRIIAMCAIAGDDK